MVNKNHAWQHLRCPVQRRGLPGAHIQRLRNDLSLFDNYESRSYSYGRKCEWKGEL